MTAAAMIVGMIPMAIGGAGEEQNAALARAVIGGLLFATPTTLLIVPTCLPCCAKQRRKASPWRIRGSTPMTKMRVLPENEDVQDQADPETDRVVAPMKPVRRRRGYGGALLAGGVLLLLTGGLAMGGWRHYQAERDVAATAQQSRSFVPDVSVAAVRAGDSKITVTLPATTTAFEAANIFARASGYIEKR